MEAAASVKRARGEHAALRVLANVARLARDNPELVQLRLLQTIGASKGRATVILGNDAIGARGAAVRDEARVPE